MSNTLGPGDQELVADLIRVLIFDIAERIPFGQHAYNDTPFTRAFEELARKYGVPSVTDRGPVVRAAPQIPEGKIRNA